VKKYLLVAQRVWHMAFTPEEKIPAGDQWRIERRFGDRLRRPKVIKTIQVGELPWGSTIAPHDDLSRTTAVQNAQDIPAPAYAAGTQALSISGGQP